MLPKEKVLLYWSSSSIFEPMDSNKIFEMLAYTLPAIITGLVALYFFKKHVENEDRRRAFLMRKEGHKTALPLRLQAYERLTLFLERISPNNLLPRVKPTGKDPKRYAEKLIAIIDQELEHNLAQQVYVSDTAWKAVTTAKNVSIQIIRAAAEQDKIEEADQLREEILKQSVQKESPTKAALAFLRIEAQKLF